MSYKTFAGYLDLILMAFDDLKDNCPADYDDELTDLIVKAQKLIQQAYELAIEKGETA